MAYNYGNYYGNNGSWNNVNQPVNYSQGMNYQQMPSQNYQQMQQPQIQMPMQPNYSQGSQHTGINWVQGQAGANVFYLAPGQSALLMDSQDPVLYVKSVDMTGRPQPQVMQPSQDMSEYVKISDLESKVTDMVNKAVSKALE